MSTTTPHQASPGRLFILFMAQLRIDSHAAGAWASNPDGHDWDHVVDHSMQGAVASQAAHCRRAGLDEPTVAWRHVTGGVAEATAAASQLLGKSTQMRVLIAYIDGPGQADDVTELGSALAPALTTDNQLVVFVGRWQRRLGHSQRWERVFSALVLNGPDVEDTVARSPHPVLDGLRPELPTLS